MPSLSCQVCLCNFSDINAFKGHIRFSKHKEEIQKVFPNDHSKINDWLPFIKVMKKKTVFIGTSLLTFCFADEDIIYLCHVCEEKCPEWSILNHLSSGDHLSNYLSYTEPNSLTFSWIPNKNMNVPLMPDDKSRSGELQILQLPPELMKKLDRSTYSEVMQILSKEDKLLTKMEAVRPKRILIGTYQQDCNRKHPLLGMQHVVECICSDSRRYYLCTLCSLTFGVHMIIKHVLSFDHIYRYFNVWHPSTLMSKESYNYNNQISHIMLGFAKQTEEIFCTSKADMKQVNLQPHEFGSINFASYREALKKLESITQGSSLITVIKPGKKLEHQPLSSKSAKPSATKPSKSPAVSVEILVTGSATASSAGSAKQSTTRPSTTSAVSVRILVTGSAKASSAGSAKQSTTRPSTTSAGSVETLVTGSATASSAGSAKPSTTRPSTTSAGSVETLVTGSATASSAGSAKPSTTRPSTTSAGSVDTLVTGSATPSSAGSAKPSTTRPSTSSAVSVETLVTGSATASSAGSAKPSMTGSSKKSSVGSAAAVSSPPKMVHGSWYKIRCQKTDNEIMEEILGKGHTPGGFDPKKEKLVIYNYVQKCLERNEPAIGLQLVVTCVRWNTNSANHPTTFHVCFACRDCFPEHSLREHFSSQKHLIHTLRYMNPWRLPLAWKMIPSWNTLKSAALEEQRSSGPDHMMVKILDTAYMVNSVKSFDFEEVMMSLQQHHALLKSQVPPRQTYSKFDQNDRCPLLGEDFMVKFNVCVKGNQGQDVAFLCLLCRRRLSNAESYMHVFSKEHMTNFIDVFHPGSLLSNTDKVILLDLAKQAARIHVRTHMQDIKLDQPIWEPCNYLTATHILGSAKKRDGKGRLEPRINSSMMLVYRKHSEDTDKDKIGDKSKEKTQMTDGTEKLATQKSTDGNETTLKKPLVDVDTEVTKTHVIENREKAEKLVNKGCPSPNEKKLQPARERSSKAGPAKMRTENTATCQVIKMEIEEPVVTNQRQESPDSCQKTHRTNNEQMDRKRPSSMSERSPEEEAKEISHKRRRLSSQQEAQNLSNTEQKKGTTADEVQNGKPSPESTKNGALSDKNHQQRTKLQQYIKLQSQEPVTGLDGLLKCQCDERDPIYLCVRCLKTVAERDIIGHVTRANHHTMYLMVVDLDEGTYNKISEENFHSAYQTVKAQVLSSTSARCAVQPNTSVTLHVQPEVHSVTDDIQVVDMEIDCDSDHSMSMPSSSPTSVSVMTGTTQIPSGLKKDDSELVYIESNSADNAHTCLTVSSSRKDASSLHMPTSGPVSMHLHHNSTEKDPVAAPVKISTTSKLVGTSQVPVTSDSAVTTSAKSVTTASRKSTAPIPSSRATNSSHTKVTSTSSNQREITCNCVGSTSSVTAATTKHHHRRPSVTLSVSQSKVKSVTYNNTEASTDSVGPTQSNASAARSTNKNSPVEVACAKQSESVAKIGIDRLLIVSSKQRQQVYCLMCSVRVKSGRSHFSSFTHQYDYVEKKYPGQFSNIPELRSNFDNIVANLAEAEKDTGSQRMEMDSKDYQEMTNLPDDKAVEKVKMMVFERQSQVSSSTTVTAQGCTLHGASVSPYEISSPDDVMIAPDFQLVYRNKPKLHTPLIQRPESVGPTKSNASAARSTNKNPLVEVAYAKQSESVPKIGVDQLLIVSSKRRKQVYCLMCSVRVKSGRSHFSKFTHQYDYVEKKYPGQFSNIPDLRSNFDNIVANLAEAEKDTGSQRMEVDSKEYQELANLPDDKAVEKVKMMVFERQSQVSSSTTVTAEGRTLHGASVSPYEISSPDDVMIAPDFQLVYRNKPKLHTPLIHRPETESISKEGGNGVADQSARAQRSEWKVNKWLQCPQTSNQNEPEPIIQTAVNIKQERFECEVEPPAPAEVAPAVESRETESVSKEGGKSAAGQSDGAQRSDGEANDRLSDQLQCPRTSNQDEPKPISQRAVCIKQTFKVEPPATAEVSPAAESQDSQSLSHHHFPFVKVEPVQSFAVPPPRDHTFAQTPDICQKIPEWRQQPPRSASESHSTQKSLLEKLSKPALLPSAASVNPGQQNQSRPGQRAEPNLPASSSGQNSASQASKILIGKRIPGPSDLCRYLSVKRVDSNSVIGLDSVWECRGMSLATFFLCESCGVRVFHNDICQHMVSCEHQYKHAMLRYPQCMWFWQEQDLPESIKLETLSSVVQMLSQRERFEEIDAQVVLLSHEFYEHVKTALFSEALRMVQNINIDQNLWGFRRPIHVPRNKNQRLEEQQSSEPPLTEKPSALALKAKHQSYTESGHKSDNHHIEWTLSDRMADVSSKGVSSSSPPPGAATYHCPQETSESLPMQPQSSPPVSQDLRHTTELKIKQEDVHSECPAPCAGISKSSQTQPVSLKDEYHPTRKRPADAPLGPLLGSSSCSPKNPLLMCDFLQHSIEPASDSSLPNPTAASTFQSPMKKEQEPSKSILLNPSATPSHLNLQEEGRDPSESTLLKCAATCAPVSPELQHEESSLEDDEQDGYIVDEATFALLKDLVRNCKFDKKMSNPDDAGTTSPGVGNSSENNTQPRWDSKSKIICKTPTKQNAPFTTFQIMKVEMKKQSPSPDLSEQAILTAAPENQPATHNAVFSADTMLPALSTASLQQSDNHLLENTAQVKSSPTTSVSTNHSPGQTLQPQRPSDDTVGEQPISTIITPRVMVMKGTKVQDNTVLTTDDQVCQLSPSPSSATSEAYGQYSHMSYFPNGQVPGQFSSVQPYTPEHSMVVYTGGVNQPDGSTARFIYQNQIYPKQEPNYYGYMVVGMQQQQQQQQQQLMQLQMIQQQPQNVSSFGSVPFTSTTPSPQIFVDLKDYSANSISPANDNNVMAQNISQIYFNPSVVQYPSAANSGVASQTMTSSSFTPGGGVFYSQYSQNQSSNAR